MNMMAAPPACMNDVQQLTRILWCFPAVLVEAAMPNNGALSSCMLGHTGGLEWGLSWTLRVELDITWPLVC